MNNKKGFTLIELLVVVLIIGILAAVALPQYTRTIERSRATEGILSLKAMADAGNRIWMMDSNYTNLSLANLDVTPPTTTRFSFQAYTNAGNGYVIACRNGTAATSAAAPAAANCTGANAMYLIFFTLTNGQIAARTCTDLNSNTFCGGISLGN